MVGLITTDGSLSRSGRHIVFTTKDLQLAQTFCHILKLKPTAIKLQAISGYNKAAGSTKRNFKIQLGDKKLYQWLVSIGLQPNKTHNLDSLLISDKFFPDFLRGWIDGDGCILTYQDNYQTYKEKQYHYSRLYIQLVSASKPHLTWLHQKIQTLLSTRGTLTSQKNQHGTYWRLRFTKKDSLKILNWIYYKPSLPKLNRKFLKAKPYLLSPQFTLSTSSSPN